MLKDLGWRSFGRFRDNHSDGSCALPLVESTRACYERAEQGVVSCLAKLSGGDGILGPVQPNQAASTVRR